MQEVLNMPKSQVCCSDPKAPIKSITTTYTKQLLSIGFMSPQTRYLVLLWQCKYTDKEMLYEDAGREIP